MKEIYINTGDIVTPEQAEFINSIFDKLVAENYSLTEEIRLLKDLLHRANDTITQLENFQQTEISKADKQIKQNPFGG